MSEKSDFFIYIFLAGGVMMGELYSMGTLHSNMKNAYFQCHSSLFIMGVGMVLTMIVTSINKYKKKIFYLYVYLHLAVLTP